MSSGLVSVAGLSGQSPSVDGRQTIGGDSCGLPPLGANPHHFLSKGGDA